MGLTVNVQVPEDQPAALAVRASGPALSGAALARIRAALDAGSSANTRRAYRTHWTAWEAWAAESGADPLPADPLRVAEYLTARAEGVAIAGRSHDPASPATLSAIRAALSAAHRAAGRADPTAAEGVRQVLRGLRRAEARAPRQAAPITQAALAAIKATAALPRKSRQSGRVETEARAQARAALDVAVVSVMRDALLRVSEAAALTWGDIDVEADGSGRLTVARSKTDQQAAGAVQFLGRAAGLPGTFSGHSPRVGMAQDLSAAGAELPELMQAGRWSSSAMPARYTRSQSAGRSAVAKFYQR